MSAALRLALAAALLLAGTPAAASGWLAPSPYLEPVPGPEPCDVIVNPGNAATTLSHTSLNDPTKRVFCVEAGDYRGVRSSAPPQRAGLLILDASGTPSQRRFLRFHPDDGVPNAVLRPARALFSSIRIYGSWWVIQGITVQPQGPEHDLFVDIHGGDYNLLDGNLIDGSEQDNQGFVSAIMVAPEASDAGSHNVIQRNVVRSGNPNRLGVDYIGIVVIAGYTAGANSDFNRILDNEVYDWGDGIALGADAPDCNYPARPHGTVIDGNDVYITDAKRVRCGPGAPDPNGECACAENGIDLKPDPGSDPALWTRVTNNRLWGFRPTRPYANSCGGSGSNGQAMGAGNECPGHVVVAGNVIGDTTSGIYIAGANWILAANLFYHVIGQAIAPLPGLATDLEIQFNTVADVGDAYDDMSTNTDTRCNVVVDNLALHGQGGPRGAGHQTEYNFLYHSPANNFVGATNEIFPTEPESGNTDFCFWRKRWTAPELVCVPFGQTNEASPHVAAAASCAGDLVEPYGLGKITYTSLQAIPEAGAAGAGSCAALVLAVLASRRAGHRKSR
jgi:hypothetical protein